MNRHTNRTILTPMHERLGGDAGLGSEASGFRRLGSLMLAFLVAAALPLFVAPTALGDHSDSPVAPVGSKNEAELDDDDVDDDDDDDACGLSAHR
jgi:hypothetical protein